VVDLSDKIARAYAMRLPADFFTQPLLRSYAVVGEDGNLYRVEVRGEKRGHKVQVRFPVLPQVNSKVGAIPIANEKE